MNTCVHRSVKGITRMCNLTGYGTSNTISSMSHRISYLLHGHSRPVGLPFANLLSPASIFLILLSHLFLLNRFHNDICRSRCSNLRESVLRVLPNSNICLYIGMGSTRLGLVSLPAKSTTRHNCGAMCKEVLSRSGIVGFERYGTYKCVA